MKRSRFFILMSLLATTSVNLDAAEFVEIGANLLATAVSADGQYVVGSTSDSSFANRRAFRWSRDTGLQTLGSFTGAASVASDVTADGSVVIGYRDITIAAPQEAFVWTELTGMVGLGIPAGFRDSSASEVSNDGMTIVGSISIDGTAHTLEPFRWTEKEGIVRLGVPTDWNWASTRDVSADGSTIIGAGRPFTSSSENLILESFVWDDARGFELIGPLPSDSNSVAAFHISADGNTVVGTDSPFGGIGQIFRWTREGGADLIPGLPTTINDRGHVGGVSADGSILVGMFDQTVETRGDAVAYVWDVQHGTRYLRDVLVAEHGLPEQELEVLERLRFGPILSDNATTIVGWNENEMGLADSWAIFLDKPLVSLGPSVVLPGDYNNNGTVEQADLDLVLLHWGADASAVPDTWTNDLPTGAIDQHELDGVLLNWGNASAPIGATSLPEPTAVWLLVVALVGALMVRQHYGLPPATC